MLEFLVEVGFELGLELVAYLLPTDKPPPPWVLFVTLVIAAACVIIAWLS